MPPELYDRVATSLPEPIPSIWKVRTGLHRTLDRIIDFAERKQLALHDKLFTPILELVLPKTMFDAFERTPKRLVGRVYGTLRAAHWYV